MLCFLKFIRGYLCIRVSGFSPERFLNLCGNKGILLWDIHKEGDSYLMCISLRGFYQLRSIAKKTRTKVVVLKRNGLPFLLPYVKKRSVFVVGFILAILFWYMSGMFVWEIELEGNACISMDQMNQFLSGQNVQEGMLKKELDIEGMKKEIRKQFPTVTWTSAKLDGTKLIISIKENDAPIMEKTILEQANTGYDLVAPFSGKIVAMVVREGVPNVKIGDEVEAGQVLVDGKIPIFDENGEIKTYHFTTADADIMIAHVINYAENQKTEYLQKEYTGRIKKQSFFKFGNSKSWKNKVEKPFLFYDCVMNWSRPILLEKMNFPIYFGQVEYREYQNTEHLYTQEEIQLNLNKKFLEFLQTLEQKGVQIIEKDVKIEKDGEAWILHGNLVVQENCSKLVETQGVEISE